MEIKVRVVDIQPQRRRVTLALVSPEVRDACPPANSGPRVGDRLEGEVAGVLPGHGGDYLVLKVSGGLAELPWSNMTSELREDLRSGDVELGEVVDVEVAAIDSARASVLVRDLPGHDPDNS